MKKICNSLTDVITSIISTNKIHLVPAMKNKLLRTFSLKEIFYLFVSIYLISFSFTSAQNYTKIKSIIANVNADTVMKNLRILTGAEQVAMDGVPVTIASRFRYTEGNSNAALYIKKKLSNYPSITVSEQPLSGGGKNIIATQLGKTTPGSLVIICAHFDTHSDITPGADDDGSGTVAVLEAARLLSQHGTDYTVVYALFDREEDDLNGSEHYASLAKANGTTILAVINLDMIGWDKFGAFEFEVIKRDTSTSNALAARVIEANTQCEIGASLRTGNHTGIRDADNLSFWNKGYPAVLIIELSQPSNPYMHKATDVVGNIHQAFLTKGVQLGIASAASYFALDDAPLPVELNYFDGSFKSNKVELIWKTSTEVNNYGFSIERRTKNEEWKAVGFVKGSGNSNSSKSYFFIDNLEHDLNFDLLQYRLKQIDFDGKYEYSKVVEVSIVLPAVFKLEQNYPNPFNPETVIRYQISVNSYVCLKVFDFLGREVATLVDEYKQPGIYKSKFYTQSSAFSSGIYFYNLKAGSYSETKKLLLIK